MIKNDLRSEFRGGNSPSHLEECYIPLSSYEVSPNELSQECSTKAIVSVGVPRPADFTFVEGFTWQSSNSAVCNVLKISNFEAEVSFLAIGSCEITVSHPEVPNDIRIMCSSNAVPLKSFALSATSLSQEYSTTAEVTIISLTPANFTNTTGFVWSSSNMAVCYVNKNGNYGATITFSGQGSCIITVTHPELPAKTIACTSRAIALKSFTLDPASITKQTGNRTDVMITPVPTNFTYDAEFTWSTSNSGVATLTKIHNYSSRVNFVGVGNATITVAYPGVSSKTIACISQAPPVTNIVVTGTPDNKPFESYQLGVQVLPENATDKNVTWSSSNTALATVDSNGLVTNKNKPGYMAIRAHSVGSPGVSGSIGNTITDPLDLWTKRTSGVTDSLMDITYGNGLYVAVGYNGTILTSPDAITWTKRDSGLTAWLFEITYGNGLYVAVGWKSTILTSSDGITWTKRTIAIAEYLDGITYGNGLYVAVGTSDILTSSDGITWTMRTTEVTADLKDVTYGDGLYVAVGWRGIVTSPDGVTWTNVSDGSEFLTDIIYVNGRYVATSDRGNIVTSINGTMWTKRTIGPWTATLYGITYGNGFYIITGDDGIIVTSPDTGTWAIKTSGVTDTIYGVTSVNGLYVAVGNNGTILTCRML